MFWYLFICNQGDEKIVELLLKKDAKIHNKVDINAKDSDGKTLMERLPYTWLQRMVISFYVLKFKI